MAKTRSPNYPRIGLKEAVSRVKMLYDQEGRGPTSREAMAVAVGYSGISGASDAVLAALNKFGLIEKQGEDYFVSNLAMAIMYPTDETEKYESAKEAALSPSLFRELYDHFGGRLPSDKNLEVYLLRNNFSKSAVGLAISAFRETLDFLELEGGLAAVPEQEPPKAPSGHLNTPPTKVIDEPVKGERLLFQAQVGKDSYCKVLVSGPFGRAELMLLMEHLQLQLKMFGLGDAWRDKPGAESVDSPKSSDETLDDYDSGS